MRSLVGPACALLVLHVAFFSDVLCGDRTLSASAYVAGLTPHNPQAAAVPRHILDVEGAAWVDEPSPYLTERAIAAGELPLWNPGTGLGMPLAANLNSGAGNPFQLPLNLAPTPAAADFFYLGRLLLLALFTWTLLRELGMASAIAVVGAVVVGYGGYPLAWIAHHPLSSELFLPLMLVGFERGRRGGAGGWVVLVVAAAGSLFGGKLQASLLCFAFVAVWACHRGIRSQGGAGAATPIATGLGLGLGTVAAAVLLVPAAELMVRASGLTLGGRAQLASFTVPWSSLASLAVPAVFVPPGQVFPDGLLTPAIGIGAVVLAALGTVATASPYVHLARVSVLWAVAMLLRNAGAMGDLATRLPAIRGILFVKYTFTVVFALAVAAAVGLDAVLAGRIDAARARRVIPGALLAIVMVTLSALAVRATPTFPAHALVPVGCMAAVALLTGAWAAGMLGRGGVAACFGLLVVAELWSFAPHRHPPRRDPYRAPAFVEFLRQEPPGRVLADADLLVPLTSAAVGLQDVRAIDVLTPGAYYAFFTRLLSFCDRVIHFTVDPDLAVAATSPALDLAGVRYVVSRQALPDADLAIHVRRQVGRERTARLLAGLVRLRTEGGPLAIGPVTSVGDERFAFTLTTPFTLDLTADSEAPELAWGVLGRGEPADLDLRVLVEGLPSDAPSTPVRVSVGEGWQEHRVRLARAGESRRVRLRLTGTSTAGPIAISFGNLGFSEGALAETRLAAERAARHEAEARQLRRVFDDAEQGVVVYENGNALPRAFRVRQAEPSASVDAALTRLGDGLDFRRTALVETADAVAVRAALEQHAGTADGRNEGTAEIREETPGTVVITTDGTTPAVLVLADLAFPGWRADIDGQPARVLTIDGLLRGVVVPAGAHRVVFRYRPTSLLIGAVLSGLALAALVPFARAAAGAHSGDRRA